MHYITISRLLNRHYSAYTICGTGVQTAKTEGNWKDCAPPRDIRWLTGHADLLARSPFRVLFRGLTSTRRGSASGTSGLCKLVARSCSMSCGRKRLRPGRSRACNRPSATQSLIARGLTPKSAATSRVLYIGSSGKPRSLESCSSSGKRGHSSIGPLIWDPPFGSYLWRIVVTSAIAVRSPQSSWCLVVAAGSRSVGE